MADSFTGEIRPFAGNFVPVNWHACDGSLLRVSNYQALFSLIGTTYGGDGINTFQLPDLRGRLPVGFGQGPNLTNRALGQMGGSEAVTLTDQNMPSHSHPLNASTAAATGNSPKNMLFANPAPNAFYANLPAGPAVQALNPDTIPLSGGSNYPHENRMPVMAINYIICLNGIFPQRP